MSKTTFKRKAPILEGTFLTDTLIAPWDDETWEKELLAYQEVGIKYLVLTSNILHKKDGSYIVNYPTEIDDFKDAYHGNDLIEKLLKNAKKFKMKVFIGLNFDDIWWSYWWDTEYITSNCNWLYEQMLVGNKIADELYELYYDKYSESFYGWYWIWEFWNSTAMALKTKGRMQNIKIFSNCLNISIDHLNELNIKMPLMFSPFANLKLDTSKHDLYHMWHDIIALTKFRTGDIICPQDSVGAGGVSFDQLEDYYTSFKKAVDTKPGLKMWANNENFEQSDWSSATLGRFVKQMEISAPYVERHITYSYNSYYSPLNVNPGLHETYKKYVEEGRLSCEIPNAPLNVNVVLADNGVAVIGWDEDSDMNKIAGYEIYKNNELIGSIKCDRNDGKGFIPLLKCSFEDTCFTNDISEENIEYAVTAFDFAGNFSIRSKCILKKHRDTVTSYSI
jgi:hypothetical protein